jgi:hypothetical protein
MPSKSGAVLPSPNRDSEHARIDSEDKRIGAIRGMYDSDLASAVVDRR